MSPPRPRICCRIARLLLLIATAAPAARAAGDDAPPADTRVTGVVVASRARFTTNPAQVVTESRILQPDGRELTVTQRGGEVGEVGTVVNGAPPLLERGDRVELRARPSQTRRGAPAWTVAALDRLDRASEPRATGSHLRYAPMLTRETHSPVYWASGCIFVTLDAAGTAQIPGDLELSVMSATFDHWVAATEGCSYLRFVMEAPRPVVVGLDRQNVVVFREDRWCTPATDDAPEECHDPAAVGLTTTSYVKSQDSDRYAEILDVDIELNAVDYVFAVGAGSVTAPGCPMDLASVVTHEVGHLLGLAHGCLMPEDDPQLRDEDGEPLLPCQPSSALPDPVRFATMAGEASCGDASKATVEADDVRGVCSLYPLGEDPGTCRAPAPLEAEAGCGCRAVGTSSPAAAWGPIAGAALLAVRARRRWSAARPVGAR